MAKNGMFALFADLAKALQRKILIEREGSSIGAQLSGPCNCMIIMYGRT